MYNRPLRITQKLGGIILFFKLFGFHPYSRSTSTNTCLVIYSILRICISFLSFEKNDKVERRFVFYLTELVMQIVYGGLFVGYVVFSLESFVYRKVLSSFYTKYDKLEETCVPGRNSNGRVFLIRLKMSIFIFLIIFLSAQALYHKFDIDFHIDVHDILMMVYTFNGIVRCAQFVVHVELIHLKLFDLHDQLVVLKENEMTFKLYNKLQKNFFEKKLENCRDIYGKIYDLVLDINQCFGWSVLCIVVEIFYSLTSNAYWTCLVLLDEAPGSLICESFYF